METTKKQKKLTKKFEGLRLKAYADGNGNMTIGYGHRIRTEERKKTISIVEAEKLFLEDMNEVEKQVTAEELNLNQHQFDAVCDFVYNVGIGNFRQSTLIKLIKENRNNIAIAKEFMKWIYIKGKKSDGLVHRREVEYLVYFQDIYTINK